MVVVGMLQTAILLDAGGVGQMHPVPMVLEQIHQLVPVVGGLHHDPGQIGFIRRPKTKNEIRFVGQLSFHDSFPVLVQNGRLIGV